MSKHLVWILCMSICARAIAQPTVTVAPENQRGTVQVPEGAAALLQKPVTVRIERASVSRALDAVIASAKVRIAYSPKVVDASGKVVTLTTTQTPLKSTIEQILSETPFKLVVLPGGHLAIAPSEASAGMHGDTSALSQSKTMGVITGRVIDSVTQKKIPGVMVTVVGTKLSVVTDTEGAFRIDNVPAGSHVLTTKLLGYKSQTIRVIVARGVSQSVTIPMIQTSTTLSEVVTTVTGSQRKIEIGNDITTLDVPEIMKQAPITSVTDLLEARVPGLTVMRTSGVPGASSRIRLRGIGGGLLSGVSGAPTNDPIVIVDGIRVYAGQTGVDDQKLGGGKYPTPSPIDQIDPNSIEKIEVLRGPSAAAMYGADAGDGVIVITTKKGKAGATRWDVAASRGTESIPGAYAAAGYYRFGHDPRGSLSDGQVICPSIRLPETYFQCALDSLVRFQALNESRLSTLGRGSNTRVTGTVSGGSKDLTYSVTGSMSNSLGLTKMPPLYQDLFRTLYDSAPSERMRRPNSLDFKSGQLSLSSDFGHGLMATYTTSLSQSIQNQSSANDQLSQLSSVYVDTNNINPGRPGQYAYQLNVKNVRGTHALALNLLRWDWFPLTGTLGMDRVERTREGLAPRGIVMINSEGWAGGYPVVHATMSVGKFSERRENINISTGRVNGTLLPRARISVSVGSEITQRSNSAIEGESDTLVEGVSRPTTLASAIRSGRITTTGGWFLEPRLNVNSRFFVNPGFRLDGGGVSGSRSGFRGGLLSLFPKLNFSWIALDREGREPLWGIVSVVRPRLAFGIAGVQPAAEWNIRTLEQHTVLDNVGIAPDLGLRLRTVGNTKLGPEKTREAEGGVDIQLWDTRLTLSATGFYKMRKNAIQQIPLAPSAGAVLIDPARPLISHRAPLFYYSNIGHVRNAGVEFSLNAMVLDLPDIAWTVDVSVSKYTNTLAKLFGEQRVIDLGDGTRLVEGYPLFGRWSRPISGWTEPTNGSKLWYGDFAVADSAVYMGMQAPNFQMPFRTSLTLLRGLLTVNGQFDYRSGMTQNNLGGGALLGNIYDNPSSTYGQQAYALAASCFLGLVDAVAGGGTRGTGCTDYGFIQKINSLRFNSMSVGYNVPRAYLKRFPITSLSVSVQGSNLGLWTNYRGKDPDVNGNLIGDVTQDSGQLPVPRAWSLQIRVGT